MFAGEGGGTALTDMLTVTFPKGSAHSLSETSHVFVSNHERSSRPPSRQNITHGGASLQLNTHSPAVVRHRLDEQGRPGGAAESGPRGDDMSPCHACPCITAPQPGASRREQRGGGGGGYIKGDGGFTGTPPVSRD